MKVTYDEHGDTKTEDIDMHGDIIKPDEQGMEEENQQDVTPEMIAFSKANTQIINNYEFINSIDKFLPHCKDGTVYHKLLEIKQGIQVDTQYLEEQAQNL